MTEETDKKNAKHKKAMEKQKSKVDANIEAASTERGVSVLLTGNGKGKSSSAFGMLARALGHGMRVGVAQFIKGRSDTGEEAFFGQQDNVSWHVSKCRNAALRCPLIARANIARRWADSRQGSSSISDNANSAAR